MLARSDSYTPDLAHLLPNKCNRTFCRDGRLGPSGRLFRQQIQPIAPRRNHGFIHVADLHFEQALRHVENLAAGPTAQSAGDGKTRRDS